MGWQRNPCHCRRSMLVSDGHDRHEHLHESEFHGASHDQAAHEADRTAARLDRAFGFPCLRRFVYDHRPGSSRGWGSGRNVSDRMERSRDVLNESQPMILPNLFLYRRLTDAELRAFHNDGYLRLGPTLTSKGLSRMREECMAAWNASKGAFDPNKTWLQNSLLR